MALALVGCGTDDFKPHGKAWIGKTFLLDTPATSNSSWKKPMGFGPIILNFVPQFLFGVGGTSSDDLVITLAAATDGAQDMCTPTPQVHTSGADYPTSTITAPTLPLHLVSKDPQHPGKLFVTAHDVVFKDILPGIQGMATAQFDAVIDFSDFSALFSLSGSSKEDFCSTLEATDSPCEVCSLSGERFCWSIRAIEIGAQEISTPLIEVSSSTIPVSCLQ